MGWLIGVDVVGTFIDFLVHRRYSGGRTSSAPRRGSLPPVGAPLSRYSTMILYLAFNESNGKACLFKRPSTPENRAEAIVMELSEFCHELAIDAQAVTPCCLLLGRSHPANP